MLRVILIYLSQAGWARKIVQRMPFAQKMASRFVAGETLDEAIRVVKALNLKGINTTLDHLGENVYSQADAVKAAEEILGILDRLKIEGVASGVSIKLSQIGLIVDREICKENLTRILELAQTHNIFVRVDMEDSPHTDDTLEIFSVTRSHINPDLAGVAIQAYLYRSENDVRNLLESNAGIRLCKGAYKEPPGIAFPKKLDVDQNFDRITKMLLDKSLMVGSKLSQDGINPPIPAIATHDEARINYAKNYKESIRLDSSGLEFQMLYGIRTDLQEQLVNEGYPVRVYVPYGQEWYPYFVRRLAERPANLWFFLTNLLRK